MKSLKKQYETGQLPEADLSAPEQQLLKRQVDQEMIRHWDTIIARHEADSMVPNLHKIPLKWMLIITLATLAVIALVRFGKNDRKAAPASAPQPMAGVVAYPFSEHQVRGFHTPAGATGSWQEAVIAYRNGDYRQALDKSQALQEPFFTGMCLLYLQEPQKALEQFDAALRQPGAPIEVQYYKGLALRQLGREADATAAWQQVVASMEARGVWKEAAKKALDGGE